jgi:peptide/nickel transport system permease protein
MSDSLSTGDAASGPARGTSAGAPGGATARSGLGDIVRMFRRSHAAVFGLALVAALTLAAVLAPVLTPHDPNEVDTARRLARPLTAGHPLGTDEFGRDMAARLVHGARISLAVGLAATALAALAGSLCGLLAGLGGGWIDHAIMRSIDTLMAFPYFLLAIAIIAALGPGLVNGMIAVAVVNIPFYGRIVRGTVLAVRETEYVQAARALGVTPTRLAVKHVLRNCLAPIIVAVTLNVGGMITALAGLSFLGLGVQPPVSDWGSMLSSSRQYINVAPHVAALPGLAIFLAVLGFNLLGDGLRDALDPRLR